METKSISMKSFNVAPLKVLSHKKTKYEFKLSSYFKLYRFLDTFLDALFTVCLQESSPCQQDTHWSIGT